MKGAFEVLQNRCFNSSGKAGGNIPLDLRMEHLNKLLKIALKQFASNVTEAAAQQIAKSLSTIEDILLMVDVDCNLKHRSGYHNSKHLEEIVLTITNDLHEKKAYSVPVCFFVVRLLESSKLRRNLRRSSAAAGLVELAFRVVFLTYKLHVLKTRLRLAEQGTLPRRPIPALYL